MAISLALRSKHLPINRWKTVLRESLHSIRSFLCTLINCTPHERMFEHHRKSQNSKSLPSWLMSTGQIFMKNYVCQSKFDPLVKKVELIDANPMYTRVLLPNGKEAIVSIRHLVPRDEVDMVQVHTEEELEIIKKTGD
uniref:Uncharacterized protein n=1 Tax=Graphocephala atropunctata TaxID=36148 RepID=A0A1B6L070_9HEMI